MNTQTINTDTEGAQAQLTKLLKTNTNTILVIEELIDKFTRYAYFIPLENGVTVQKRWEFKHDHHVDHPNSTPIGVWSSSTLPHDKVAQQLTRQHNDEFTISAIGDITITSEDENNTKFLVNIDNEHIETHVDNYYEDYAVEEIPTN